MSVLLDTHTAFWLVTDTAMAQPALDAIEDATSRGDLLFSPVSAWEIGMLVRKGRLQLDRRPELWVALLLGKAGVRIASLSPEAAVGASFLPGVFHSDPADRLLVATARHLDVPIVTRDGKILDYARTGAVRAIPC